MTPLDELKRLESVMGSKHAVASHCLTVDLETLKNLVADSKALRALDEAPLGGGTLTPQEEIRRILSIIGNTVTATDTFPITMELMLSLFADNVELRRLRRALFSPPPLPTPSERLTRALDEGAQIAGHIDADNCELTTP